MDNWKNVKIPFVWIIALFIVTVALKACFPYWNTLHISFTLTALYAIVSLPFRFQSQSRRVMFWSLLPVFMLAVVSGTIGDPYISRFVCQINGASDFETIAMTRSGSDFTLCAHIDRCTFTPFEEDGHIWQVCLMRDPFNAENTLLYGVYDADLNADNAFITMGDFNQYYRGAMVIKSAAYLKKIDEHNCTVREYCPPDYFPLLEASRR